MERINRLNEILKKDGLDAFFIKGGVNIRYLTGYTGDDAFLLICPYGKDIFITDFRYIEQAQKECGSCLGLEIIRSGKEGNTALKIIEAEAAARGLKKIGFEEEGISYGFYQKLKAALLGAELIPKFGCIEELRQIKDKGEEESLKKAAKIADKALEAVLPKIVPGISEIRLEAILNYELTSHGSRGQAFPPIIASGLNGSLCHNKPSLKKLAKGEFITLDFGAVYNGYRSDMTRTFILGSPDNKQKRVYQIVLNAQEEALSRLKAGVLCSDLDKTARDIIIGQGFGEYFGHSLGHGIGLDIHEKPNLSPANNEPLIKGQVVTVEPGIYIPNWGGVRIENSVIVKAEGGETITHFPRELIIL